MSAHISKEIETTDSVEDRLHSTKDDQNQWTAHLKLFRKVYSLLFLRILCFTVTECCAIYDQSISNFFSGSGGGVVIFMIWLIQIILSGYTSLSDRLGPDKPSNQNRFITLNVMECTVYAGAASNLYHSNQIQLSDVLAFNSLLGIFNIGHVLFFFNQRIRYRFIYGVLHAALSVAISLATTFSLRSPASGNKDVSTNDDPSPVDWQSVQIGCLGFLVCFWYSLETHVVVWKRHRFRFHQHQDCFFLMLCFAYADVWNVLAKCRFFVTKSSETTSLVRPDNGNLPDDFRLFSSASSPGLV